MCTPPDLDIKIEAVRVPITHHKDLTDAQMVYGRRERETLLNSCCQISSTRRYNKSLKYAIQSDAPSRSSFEKLNESNKNSIDKKGGKWSDQNHMKRNITTKKGGFLIVTP